MMELLSGTSTEIILYVNATYRENRKNIARVILVDLYVCV
jgi:hypothetical protein